MDYSQVSSLCILVPIHQTDEGDWRVMLTEKGRNGQFKWTGLTTSRQATTVC